MGSYGVALFMGTSPLCTCHLSSIGEMPLWVCFWNYKCESLRLHPQWSPCKNLYGSLNIQKFDWQFDVALCMEAKRRIHQSFKSESVLSKSLSGHTAASISKYEVIHIRWSHRHTFTSCWCVCNGITVDSSFSKKDLSEVTAASVTTEQGPEQAQIPALK